MDLLSPDDFLRWAEGLNVGPDDRYAPPARLVYVPHRSHDRFWELPERAAGVPFFAAHMLTGLERWSDCRVWPRGGGWPAADDEPARVADEVHHVILGSAGVPAGQEGGVRYERDELDRLVTLVFGQAVFGWCVRDDVFVIPDHGRFILEVDHHKVIHVQFRDGTDVARYVDHMAGEKYFLPEEVPDATFKRPEWMP
jgi:hypothetical protein